MTVVAYLTHPLGEDVMARHDVVSRNDNIANAVDWFRFLALATKWAIACPWFVYVTAVDDEIYRPLALTHQIEMLTRCDLLVLAGGRVSPHMEIERNHARNRLVPIPIVDLTDFGYVPPRDRIESARTVILARAKAAGL